VLQAVVELLDNQKLIIYPTETCYGLGGDATQVETVEKVFRVKRRSQTKPIHIAVSSVEMARHYVKVDDRAQTLFETFLPGPLTLILETRGVLPRALSTGRNTLGIRCPDHPIPQQLIEALGRPITATSANLSGQPPTYTAKEAMSQLGDAIAAIIDVSRLSYCPPSTVLDLTSKPLRLLREGPIGEAALLEVLGNA